MSLFLKTHASNKNGKRKMQTRGGCLYQLRRLAKKGLPMYVLWLFLICCYQCTCGIKSPLWLDAVGMTQHTHNHRLFAFWVTVDVKRCIWSDTESDDECRKGEAAQRSHLFVHRRLFALRSMLNAEEGHYIAERSADVGLTDRPVTLSQWSHSVSTLAL